MAGTLQRNVDKNGSALLCLLDSAKTKGTDIVLVHTNTPAMISPIGTTHAGAYTTRTTCTTIGGTALPMGLGRSKLTDMASA